MRVRHERAARNGDQVIRPDAYTIPSRDRLDLFLSDEDLERILNAGLRGLVLDQPLRTRSKVLKSKVCETLGYPDPEIFQEDAAALPRPELRHLRPEVEQPPDMERGSFAVAPVRADPRG